MIKPSNASNLMQAFNFTLEDLEANKKNNLTKKKKKKINLYQVSYNWMQLVYCFVLLVILLLIFFQKTAYTDLNANQTISWLFDKGIFTGCLFAIGCLITIVLVNIIQSRLQRNQQSYKLKEVIGKVSLTSLTIPSPDGSATFSVNKINIQGTTFNIPENAMSEFTKGSIYRIFYAIPVQPDNFLILSIEELRYKSDYRKSCKK